MNRVSLFLKQPRGFRAALRGSGVFLAFALLAPSVGASRAERSAGESVLLITVDTLRADHLGCYGYRRVETPVIDALAAHGVRFEDAFSQVPITFPSHAVILSGTYPMWDGARDFNSPPLSPHVGLLAEAFERHGYRTAAFVSAFVLDSSWGLARGFETYDDRFSPEQYETRNPGNIQRRADVTVNHLLAWLREGNFSRPGARPFFIWLHLYDPHSPYDPPEPFHHRYAGHLYDGEVAYVDSQLGRLFDYLERAGLYDRSLIVFLSDHGESLGEHGEGEHGFFIYDSTLHIPLIVKPPRGSSPPRVVNAPVAAVDVAPTLLDLARLRDPLRRQFQGASLASVVLGKASPPAQAVYAETYYPRDSFGWSALRSLTTPRYHYIDAPHPELYAWRTDPSEKHNLFDHQAALSAALQGQLLEIERRFQKAQNASSGPPLSPETLEKLKSLGYIAYSAPAAPGTSGPLPDPKSKLEVFRAILRATDLAEMGRFEESDRLLQQLAKTETRLYVIPFMLAENDLPRGHLKKAQEHFLACLKLNPDFLQAIQGLARAYHADGQDGKARPLLELAIHKNPRDFLAYYGLGLIASGRKEYAQAITYFQATVREKPDYSPAYLGLGIAQVESRKYEDALPNLQRAASLGPPEATLLNYLGIATAHTGHAQQAVEFYLRALAQKPDYAVARLNLAIAYRQLGDMEKAQREFKILCNSGSSLCQQFRRAFE